MIVIADNRGLAVGQIPQKLGQVVDKLFAIRRAEGVSQIVCEGQRDVLLGVGERKRLLAGELRLVGEYRRHNAAEAVTHGLQIRLMRYLDKALYRGLVKGVEVGLVVVPRAFGHRLQISIPRIVARAFAVGQTAVFLQIAVVERHVEARQQLAVFGALYCGARVQTRVVIAAAVRLRGHQQVARAVLLVLGDKSARRARGPAILVVQIAQHLVLFGLVTAGFDKVHELVSQVGRGHARARMHVEAAEAHFFQHVDLPEQVFLVQLAIPRPKRRAAVLAGRVFKQFFVQLL